MYYFSRHFKSGVPKALTSIDFCKLSVTCMFRGLSLNLYVGCHISVWLKYILLLVFLALLPKIEDFKKKAGIKSENLGARYILICVSHIDYLYSNLVLFI